MEPVEVSTPVGAARLHGTVAPGAVGLLLLGHGAGGGVRAPDLLAVAGAAEGVDWAVLRVEQPYRVLSARRPPPPVATLDTAWGSVLDAVRAELGWAGLLVAGGRSSGARVACRSSGRVDAVLALAFPLRPLRGRVEQAEAVRAAELRAVAVPMLVVQGERDAFGSPAQVRAVVPSARVRAVAGADHSFAARRLDGRTSSECTREVGVAAAAFLTGLISGRSEPSPPR